MPQLTPKSRRPPDPIAGRALEAEALSAMRRQQATSPMKKPPGYEPGAWDY